MAALMATHPDTIDAHLSDVEVALSGVDRAPLTETERAEYRALWRDELRTRGKLVTTAADIVADVMEGRGVSGSPHPPRAARGSRLSPDAWRRHAVTVCSALNAAQHPDARAFRAHVLKGQLLAYRDNAVSAWVRARAGKAGPLLAFADPADVTVRRVPVGRTGPLVRLQRVARTLVEDYEWTEDAAVAFLLTNATPRMLPDRVNWRRRSAWPCHGRIVMELDPMLTPDDVRTIFAAAKRDYFAGTRARTKRIGEHTARLAIFIVEAIAHLAGPDAPRDRVLRTLRDEQPALRTAWTSTPAYRRLHKAGKAPAYRHEAKFWRDALAAVSAVLFLQPVRGDRQPRATT